MSHLARADNQCAYRRTRDIIALQSNQDASRQGTTTAEREARHHNHPPKAKLRQVCPCSVKTAPTSYGGRGFLEKPAGVEDKNSRLVAF